MQDIKRICISDLHMSSQEAVEPTGGKQPYGWFSRDHAARLAQFLASNVVKECRQLFLLGDVTDRWICPHDVKPSTTLEILEAPHNKPVVDRIQAFASTPGKTVIWCKGNHDGEATGDDAHHLAFNVNLVPHYDEFPLSVRHGHEGCLFNAPDPMGRPYPLGYFISRFVATAAARGKAKVGLNLQLLFKSGDQLVALLEHEPLAKCVFDAVCHAADISLTDKVIMPDGNSLEVGVVRVTYQNLVDEWKAHRPGKVMDAVLAEWDPFYALPVGKNYLHIRGHSHVRSYGALGAGGVYMNIGSWCSPEASFAKTWIENPGEPNEVLRAELFQWDPAAGAISKSTRAIVPTGGP
jgi:UDP-2,3-diacylglucosamine pyrophosphatase LpxH